MILNHTSVFVFSAVIFLLLALVADENWDYVIKDNLLISYGQEQEIPPVAPSVPRTPTTQIPTPEKPSFVDDFANITNESANVPIEGQWVTYQNLSDGIQVDYPSQWEKVRQGNNLIFLIPLNPVTSGSGSFKSGVGFIVEDIPSNLTLSEFANKKISEMQSRLPPESFSVIESVPLQGADTHKAVFEWNDTRAGGWLKSMEFYKVYGDNGYISSYTIPSHLFDEYLPIAQKMLESVIFSPTGIPATSTTATTSNDSESTVASNNTFSDIAPGEQGIAGSQAGQPQIPTNTTGNITTPQNQFTTYQNSSFGSVQYPSNWELFDLGGGSVVFHAPLLANESIFPEEVGFLNLDTLPNPNEPIDKFFSDQLNNFKNTYTQYTLADGPSATTVGGYPAMKARFTHIENNIPYETLEIWTTNQDKSRAFQIEATSKLGLYPSFPSAHMQRIIDSFQMAAPLSPPVNNNNSALQGLNTNTSSQIDMQSGDFLTYSNATSGITVQYPSNWAVDDYKAVDPSSGVEDLVKFYPLEGRAGASDTIFMVSVDPYAGNNISANEYLTKSIEYLGSFFPNFKLVDSKTTDSGVMLSGTPAYQAIYTGSNIFDGSPFKGMEAGTILNGKAYFLTYETSPSKFDSNLSTIKKLMESFRLSTS